MSVRHEAFQEGDVYIDYPLEEVMFRFEKETGAVFRKFYGEDTEAQIPHTNKLFADARIYGEETDRDSYVRGGTRWSKA